MSDDAEHDFGDGTAKLPGFKKSANTKLPPTQLWDLMWRPEAESLWFGSHEHVHPEEGARWVLCDTAGPWRTARVVESKEPERLTLSVESSASWGEDVVTTVTICIDAIGDTRSRISISEIGVPHRCIEEVGRYWSGLLDRLQTLVGVVVRRRSNVRQAIVVIHGIGEQRPGTTLGNLVKSGVLPTEKVDRWVKPDEVSDSYELRQVTFKASDELRLPTTDVFEFYWAHIIRDTTLGQVATWLRRLLLRRRVPAPLRPLWRLMWIVLIAIVAYGMATLLGADHLSNWFASGTVLAVAAALLWCFVVKGLALDVLGDAARYLMPHPANIAHRQTIRKAGVDMIERLHASGRYDRIVILGHSLGSVIAYDIITHAWVRMHRIHRRPHTPRFGDVVRAERSIDQADATTAQDIQHAAWRQQRVNTQPWLVTDLVTVGSPLTYADYIMAESSEDFDQAKADWILPTCPPEAELKSKHKRITYNRPYTRVGGKKGTFTVFHHGAPFAVTRWTNIYFKWHWRGLKGDLIGGPIAPLFGPWIRDVELIPPRAGATHTWYWRKTKSANAHLDALRDALQLDVRSELLALLAEVPVVTLIDAKQAQGPE